MNRKARKKRKMQLKKQGLELYNPPWDSLVTICADSLPFKIARHVKGNQIQVGKLRGYEFVRPIST